MSCAQAYPCSGKLITLQGTLSSQRFPPLPQVSLVFSLTVPSCYAACASGPVHLTPHLPAPTIQPQHKQILLFLLSCAGDAPNATHHPQRSQVNSCQLILIFLQQQCSNWGKAMPPEPLLTLGGAESFSPEIHPLFHPVRHLLFYSCASCSACDVHVQGSPTPADPFCLLTCCFTKCS